MPWVQARNSTAGAALSWRCGTQSRARSVQEARSLGQAAQVVVSAAASAVTAAIAYQVGDQLKRCCDFWHASGYCLLSGPLNAPAKCPTLVFSLTTGSILAGYWDTA